MATDTSDFTPDTSEFIPDVVPPKQTAIVGDPTSMDFWNPLKPESIWAQTLGTPGSKTDAFVRNFANAGTLNQAANVSEFANGAGAAQQWRSDTQAASQAHPGAALLGTLAGAAPLVTTIGATAAPPVAGALGVGADLFGAGTSAIPVLSRIGAMGVYGGTNALGEPADTFADAAKNVALGTGIGMVAGAAGEIVPAITNAVGKSVLGPMAERIGITQEQLASEIRNPEPGTVSPAQKFQQKAADAVRSSLPLLPAAALTAAGGWAGNKTAEALGINPQYGTDLGMMLGGGLGFSAVKKGFLGDITEAAKYGTAFGNAKYPTVVPTTGNVAATYGTQATVPPLVNALNPSQTSDFVPDQPQGSGLDRLIKRFTALWSEPQNQ